MVFRRQFYCTGRGNSSDCLLKPVAIFPDPDRQNAYLVMTEVLNADGTPHATNGRATIDDDDDDFWFGFEQEYFLWDTDTQLPPGFPPGGFSRTSGTVLLFSRRSECIWSRMYRRTFRFVPEAGINVEGINAEVAAGQWEFQVFAKGAKRWR
ncbi:MAG: hypothetical protein CM15mP68_5570 [Pseudomonadota bacterium]|nr:MAG: hypothetical protein CM15mP68_5570 [Pseudomonadota bacterium]